MYMKYNENHSVTYSIHWFAANSSQPQEGVLNLSMELILHFLHLIPNQK